MNRFFLIIVLLSVQCALSSCKDGTNNAVDVIKVNDAQIQTLRMSEYFESIEYIALETKGECLIGNNPSLYITDEFVITIASKKCFVFDRLTGKFIRKIGMEGRGAGEYSQIPQGIIVNEQGKTISFEQGDKLIEYSLVDGTINSPAIRIPPLLANKIAYITKDSWVMSFLNFTGDIPSQMIFFDRERIIDSIPNRYFFLPKTREISVNRNEILFYRYKNNVYHKDLYNDTIFEIADRKLRPEWVFEMEKSTHLLHQLRGDPSTLYEEAENYHLVYFILETDKYILFHTKYQKLTHPFLFDKEQRSVKKLEHNGFVNDIDGGLTFWPDFTSQNQDLVCFYQAHVFKEEVNEKGLSAQNVKNVAEFKKTRTLAAQLNDDDNPVVVIATFKP